jgi:predicted XRE-type DNA-binding protein
MHQIAELIQAEGWKPVKAAVRCGVTHDLLRGRVSRFSLDALVNIATALGGRESVERGGLNAGKALERPLTRFQHDAVCRG